MTPLTAAAGSPVVTVAAANVVEDGAVTDIMVFTVTLSAPPTSTVTVGYAMGGGTSRAGADYEPTSGTVTFLPGQVWHTVQLATHPGAVGATYFWLSLTGASGATVGTPMVTGTITNIARLVAADPVTVHQAAYQAPSTLFAPGFLSTRGNQVIDANGRPVKLNAVNWSGLETTHYAPDGLWAQNYTVLLDQIAQLGFNAVRLPFSDQAGDAASMPDNISYAVNPDLKGLNPVQVMDKIVSYAGKIGLRIILDHHRSAAGLDPNESGLWYQAPYGDAVWLANWVWLAQHYAGNPAVIGGDLANEPHGRASWGDGGPNDWAAAAKRAGDAIHAVNPGWLIIVDGIEAYGNVWTWWGGNLMGVRDHPVLLNQPNKVVYTAHDYPASVTDLPSFAAPDYPQNLPAFWNQVWGFVYTQNIAPVWIGEFGSTLHTTIDNQWLVAFENYVNGNAAAQGGPRIAAGDQGIGTAYWTFNGTALRTRGVLRTDWQTVNTSLLQALAPSLGVPSATGAVAPSGIAPAGQAVPFEVRLKQPSAGTVSVHYATTDGTARAGTDYVGIAGDLTFGPGELVKLVTAHLLRPAGATGTRQFALVTSITGGAAQAGAPGTATIVHDPAVAPATQDPVPGGVSVRVTGVSGNAVYGTVTVTNNSPVPVPEWGVRLMTADTIVQVTGGYVANRFGSNTDVGGSGTIAAYGSASFSFTATDPARNSPIDARIVLFGNQ